MDITDEFRKLTGGNVPLKEENPLSEFMSEATEVMHSIQKISTLLTSQKSNYIDPMRFLPSKASRFTDEEREELEESVLDSYRHCEKQIDALKDKIHSVNRSNKQYQKTKIHMEVIGYLSERVKRSLQSAKNDRKQRISRPFFASKRLLPDSVELHAPETESKPTPTPISEISLAQPFAIPRAPINPIPANEEEESNKWEFTEEENERYRAENIQLHEHLHEEIEAAKRLEVQMNEISGLMGHFAENIEVQHSNIESITTNAETASTNVVAGNRSLEKAYDYGTNRGFTIFCFYSAASLLILMIHYY
ncbi:hypothetical protein THRCLA_08030 [Thraustotheca clavata]|uniref:t-SNARE coiled-coil homology domain-containing protein n=1 Tax=Thraustotheca clavata TaxID=74557 RepID=A0A1V9ZAN0_9STRA|nr:hypothetical protein THRCLA_08030 [Thraustotheca clavata]